MAPRLLMYSAVSGQAWNWNDCFDPSASRYGGAAAEIARVDVGAVVDEVLDHLVQSAHGRAVQAR